MLPPSQPVMLCRTAVAVLYIFVQPVVAQGSFSDAEADGREEDILACNLSQPGVPGTRSFRLVGHLLPNDMGRSVAGSVKFEFIPAQLLWHPAVEHFCDVMHLSDHLRTVPASQNASGSAAADPLALQGSSQSPGNMLLTYLSLEHEDLPSDNEDVLKCFSGDSWLRHVHSMVQLGLIVVFPDTVEPSYNASRLFLTFKGIRFPFLFLPSTKPLAEVTSAPIVLKDWFTSNANITCSLILKSEAKSLDSLLNSFSRTSVLFVSVSFIILMVISLSWLIFYYVQRFRYAHAKDRLARRLFNAARKALNKLPLKTVHTTGADVVADCPICIEPFHSGDVVRTLLCNHAFHKTCVDPWLLQHRTCPLCKLDILKTVGYSSKAVEESAHDDFLNGTGGPGAAGRSPEVAATVRPSLATMSDFHDPFFPTPLPSPPVQQVLHPKDVKCNKILSMTVHGGESDEAHPSVVVEPVNEDAEPRRNNCQPNVRIVVTNCDAKDEHASGSSEECAQGRATCGGPVLSYFQIRVLPSVGSRKLRFFSTECPQPGSLERHSSNTVGCHTPSSSAVDKTADLP